MRDEASITLKLEVPGAGEAVDLQSPPTRGTVRRADDIRNEALDLGMVRIAILPLTSRSDVRDSVGSQYQDELSDNLEIVSYPHLTLPTICSL